MIGSSTDQLQFSPKKRNAVEFIKVNIPHQPLKGFRREEDINVNSPESNAKRIRRELKSLQDRLTTCYYYVQQDREKHRENLLANLRQMDVYWYESDDFEKKMFRFRGEWTNWLVDEILGQLWKMTACKLKDFWSLSYEITRLLLVDLSLIRENIKKEKINNGVNLLINHFNDKIVHSLKTMEGYTRNSIDKYRALADDIKYVCHELTDRLLLDNTLPEYEKALLGRELYQFRQDALEHIQEVDNFNYELSTLVKGSKMKKIRGLTKEEFKEKIHFIIAFMETAAVPLHVFKSVGFALKKTKEYSENDANKSALETVAGADEVDYY